MKKTLFFLIISTVLWSCKRDDLVPSNSNTTVNGGKLKSFSAADGKWDLLGYGLDVTGDLLNASSVSDSPIFDIAKFANDYPSRINTLNTTAGSEHYSGGSTVVDYMMDVSNTKSFDATNGKATIEGAKKDDAHALNFTGSFKKSSTDDHKTTYSSTYSYASYEITQRIKRMQFTGDATVDLLMQYLTPEFVNNVATKSADELVARYGTHVMLDISIGGRLKFTYSGIVQNNTDFQKKTSDVKAGFGFSLGKFGVNIGSDKTKEEQSQISTTTRSKEYSGTFYGGTNSGRSITFDKDGNTTETINIVSWQQSISPTNAALLDVGNALYLYDFIADPTKKAQVKAAVEKHIANAQITLSTDPVYEFYSPGSGGNHYTSADPNATAGFTNWVNHGVTFKAYRGFVAGTVPVHLFYNGPGFDHFTTADINATGGASSWQYYGIIFYAYKTQIPGTIPVYIYYNAGGSDHFTTADPNIGQISGWVKQGITFYAYPSNYPL